MKPPGENWNRPRRRQHQPALWLGVVIAVISIAAGGYWIMGQLGLHTSFGSTSAGPEKPVEVPTNRPTQTSPATRGEATATQQEQRRGEKILTCKAKDGSTFYTNALDCNEADLENRVNVVPATQPAPQPQRTCLGAQGEERFHQFLAVCHEPFNQALRLESALLDAEDPLQSRRINEYCELITQGVQAGCMATSQQFCFLDVCQELRKTTPSQ